MKRSRSEPERKHPSIRLVRTGQRLMVRPTRYGKRFRPFPLPRMTLSLLHYCSAVADRFRREHAKALMLVLMLDRTTRSWVTPVLPSQRCARRRALWLRRVSDFAGLPSHILVGGSYQTLPVKDVFDAAASVPAVAGVHVVRRLGPNAQEVWVFLRLDDTGRKSEPSDAQLAEPSSLLVDDVEAILSRHPERLKLDHP